MLRIPRLPLVVALVVAAPVAARAQGTWAGLDAGATAGGDGLFPRCGGPSLGAGLAIAMTLSTRLSLEGHGRLQSESGVACNFAALSPLPPQPDGTFSTASYGEPVFWNAVTTADLRLRVSPWGGTHGPRLAAGMGWAGRSEQADLPYGVVTLGYAIPSGAARIVVEAEMLAFRLMRTVTQYTYLGGQVTSSAVLDRTHTIERAYGLRLRAEVPLVP